MCNGRPMLRIFSDPHPSPIPYVLWLPRSSPSRRANLPVRSPPARLAKAFPTRAKKVREACWIFFPLWPNHLYFQSLGSILPVAVGDG
jgi:hypothetical protein